MYKGCLFDLDGTLADTELVVVMTMLAFINKYDPTRVISFHELIAISGPPIKDTLAHFFPKENVDDLLIEFSTLARNYYPRYAKAFPGALALIQTLNEHNIPWGIVTSKIRRNVLVTLNVCGIHCPDDHLITLDEIQKPKPDPEPLLLGAKRIGLPVTDIIFVGDTRFDYEAAKACGMDIAMVGWSTHPLPKGSKPNHVIESFHHMREWFTVNR
jgi:pyrophosphatase PpaX